VADVTAFTALARQEFMQGKLDVDGRPMPAAYDNFVTKLSSTCGSRPTRT
jgi:hypothetical protein